MWIVSGSIATESRIKPHGANRRAGKKSARAVDVANGERGVDSDGITNFSQYAINRNIDGEELVSRIDTRIEACDEFRSRTEIRETDGSGSGWCCAVERRDKELMPDMLHRKIFSHCSVPQQDS